MKIELLGSWAIDMTLDSRVLTICMSCLKVTSAPSGEVPEQCSCGGQIKRLKNAKAELKKQGQKAKTG